MRMPDARQLMVWLNAGIIGELSEHGAVWRFRYTPEWQVRSDGFDLSPALPRAAGEIVDGSSRRPVQWFFDNLLPEEGARTLLAQDARVAEADAFGLLTHYGAESAGALTLLPPGQQPPAGSLKPLPDAELSQRIRDLPRIPLTHGAPKHMSLAGAQHKLAVVMHEGLLWEPVGHRPSSHILKPDHTQTESYPHSVANEWFTMRLADQAGLPVPAVALRRVPEPVYLVERFDRKGEGEHRRRLPVLDACQLLSLDRSYKYLQATPATLLDIIALCRFRASTRQALFRWAIFNAVVGNGDAHLKNLSYLVREDGIHLAPHYDLLSTAVYATDNRWGDTDLSWPMGQARRRHGLRRQDVLAFGEALGIPARTGERLLGELLRAIEAGADALLATLPPGMTAGEQRLLRQIRYGVMADGIRQLQDQATA